MKKLLTIFGAVGLTATGASSLVACHHKKVTTPKPDPQPTNITYDYEKLSDLAVYLCFFQYDQTTKKFTLRHGDLKEQKIFLLQDSQAISEKIWKVLGTKEFMLSKLIYYFSDKITAFFAKLGIALQTIAGQQVFSLENLEIFEFSPSTMVMTDNSHPNNVNLNWNLKFLLKHQDHQLSLNTAGSCIIPFVVLEILLNK
ncbi:lipoprotein [Spiroplasma sp. DGKH1]|uniref:lipoprotein n=1 Tax=Spiroplasma sp. DGKH1 TaxID=3050074 RepID=UPI0034C603ED